MVFKYGYVVGEHIGSMAITSGMIMQPSHVPDVINLSVTNSSRFLLIGTKSEILEWLKYYSKIIIQTSLFDDPNEAPHIKIPDVVVDLLPCYSSEAHTIHQKSFLETINPLAHPNPATEPVRLEFRAVNTKLDEEISEPYFRLVVERGKTIGEIYNAIVNAWDQIVYPSMLDNLVKVATVPVQAVKEAFNNM
ncbi:2450_t:CDS:2 [Ambispora leptoticha]|uniref:2450_t:CDS:1 n=1 Tax=Ambispora leptoticha TaxID=144679 RepID=A0A9N8Z2S0_9GLOM|nr:2450_t:CDS:2 [Ambispora leptoticha]